MMYQTFHIPKKFYNSMRIVSGADSVLLNKSFKSDPEKNTNEILLNK